LLHSREYQEKLYKFYDISIFIPDYLNQSIRLAMSRVILCCRTLTVKRISHFGHSDFNLCKQQ